MNRNAIAVIIAAVVITGGFFLFNKSKPSDSPQVKPEDVLRHALPVTSNGNEASTSVMSPAQAEAKKESHLERLKKEGYTDNPSDPSTMIKKVKSADGKEKIYVMPKDPGPNDYFEPLDRTDKTAIETLNSKLNVNPLDEPPQLRSFDDTDQNSMMLLGKFRDDVTDIEFELSKMYDEQDRATDKDVICFVSPKLGYNMKKNMNAPILVDGTGYGLLQLTESLFVRIAWSYEKKRALRGQIIMIVDGQPHSVQNFLATETRTLKHCD